MGIIRCAAGRRKFFNTNYHNFSMNLGGYTSIIVLSTTSLPVVFIFCCNCCNAARLVDNERVTNGSKVAEWQQTGGRGERLLFLAVTQCFSSQNSMLFTPKLNAFHPKTHSFPNCNPMSGDLRCSFGTEKTKKQEP